MATSRKKKSKRVQSGLEVVGQVIAFLEVAAFVSGIAGALGYGALLGGIIQPIAVFVYNWKLVFEGIILISILVVGWLFWRELKRPARNLRQQYMFGSYVGIGILMFLAVAFVIKPARLSMALLTIEPMRASPLTASVTDTLSGTNTFSPGMPPVSGELDREVAELLLKELRRQTEVLYVFPASRLSPEEGPENAAKRLNADLALETRCYLQEGRTYIVEQRLWDNRQNEYLRFPIGSEVLASQSPDLEEAVRRAVGNIYELLELNPFGYRDEAALEEATPYELYFKGRGYYQWLSLKGFEEAIRCFRQALELDPTYPLAYAGLAQAYWLASNWFRWQGDVKRENEYVQNSFKAAEKAVSLGPNLPECRLALAFSLWYKGEKTTTQEELARIDSLMKTSVQPDPLVESEWYILKALLSDSLQRKELWYRKAIERDSSSVLAYEELAHVYMATDRLAEAEQMLLKAREKVPGSALIYAVLSSLYRRSGRPQQALTMADKALQLMPDYADARYERGFAYAQLGLLTKGIRECQHAINVSPRVAYNGSFTIYEDQTRRSFRADSLFFAHLFRRHAGFAYAYLEYGNLLYQMGYWQARTAGWDAQRTPRFFQEAVRYYEKVLQMDPWSGITYLNLGWTYWNLDQRGKALEYAREAAQRLPNWYEARLSYGNFLIALALRDTLDMETRKEYVKLAGKELKAARQANPYNAGGYKALGDIYYLEGKYRRATREYRKAIEIWSGYETARRLASQAGLFQRFEEGRVSLNDVLEWIDGDSLNFYSDYDAMLGAVAFAIQDKHRGDEPWEYLYGYLLLSRGDLSGRDSTDRRRDYQNAAGYFQRLSERAASGTAKSRYLACARLAQAGEMALGGLPDSTNVLISQAVQLDSLNPEIHYLAGKCYQKKERDSLSIPYFLKAIELDSTHRRARKAVALSLYRVGRYQEAAEHYQYYLAEDSTDADILNRMGNCYYKLEQYETAAEWYRRALQYAPEDAVIWSNLGNTFDKLERYAEARKAHVQAFRYNPKDPDYLYDAVVAAYNAGENEEALRLMERLLEVDSEPPRYWNRLGLILTRSGQYPSAEKAFQVATERDPENALYWYNWGYVVFLQKQYDKALPLFEKACKLDPGDSDKWFYYARCLDATGDYATATQAYTRCLKLDPTRSLAWFNRGFVYYSREKYSRAAADFKRACELDSTNADYFLYYGLTNFFLGQYPSALKAFQTAANLAPQHPTTWLGMAYAYYRLDRIEEARQAARRVLELDPQNEQARTLTRQLEQ